MTTKRKPIRRDRRAKLTPEIIAIWHTLREIRAAGDDREYEPLGRHREFMQLNCDLCTALGGWWGTMIFPIDVTSPEPSEYMLHNPIQAEAWREAWHGGVRLRPDQCSSSHPTAASGNTIPKTNGSTSRAMPGTMRSLPGRAMRLAQQP